MIAAEDREGSADEGEEKEETREGDWRAGEASVEVSGCVWSLGEAGRTHLVNTSWMNGSTFARLEMSSKAAASLSSLFPPHYTHTQHF